MANPLSIPQFNALDRLHTIDAHVRPIGRLDLMSCFGLRTEEAAHARMKRLHRDGLVEIIEPDHRDDACSYRITPEGIAAFRFALDTMIKTDTPPPLHPDIERATLAVLALQAYGTEVAA